MNDGISHLSLAAPSLLCFLASSSFWQFCQELEWLRLGCRDCCDIDQPHVEIEQARSWGDRGAVLREGDSLTRPLGLPEHPYVALHALHRGAIPTLSVTLNETNLYVAQFQKK